LMLVLYLPSVYSAEYFVAQVRRDHQQAAQVWGGEVAAQLLEFALETQDATQSVGSPSAMAPGASKPAIALADIHDRVFGSSYAQSLKALTMLAAFRLAAMWQGWPWVMLVAGMALIDAQIRRKIKAKQFEGHDPERFAAYLLGCSLLTCAAMVGLVMPMNFLPILWPSLLAIVLFGLTRAWASFHV
jgi:Domain of unknown function (DUF4400)